jgi:hypothetical protein
MKIIEVLHKNSISESFNTKSKWILSSLEFVEDPPEHDESVIDPEWWEYSILPYRVEYMTTIDDKRVTITYDSEDDWDTIDIVFSTGRSGHTGVTNDGKQMRIFGAVINHIIFIANKLNPSKITFTANKEKSTNTDDLKDNRIKLYKKLVEKYALQYNYNVSYTDYDGYTEFTLTI